ncbi:MAG: hypothetical protein ACWGN1_06930 [Desulfobulbales bacterium]
MVKVNRRLSRTYRAFQCLCSFAALLIQPEYAWAVQQHGGAEGLVSHQIGHILFISAMIFLLYRMRGRATRGYGRFEFKLFLVLIILWNVLTFYGHWHQELINPGKYILVDNKLRGFVISSPIDALFYISRLDHLLLLPAFFCLLAALVKWRQQR